MTSLLSNVVEVETACKVCGSDIIGMKSDVMSFISNWESKDYFALISDAETAYKEIDNLYTTCIK